MTEFVLYTNPMSRGRIARWMCEETGVPYKAEILGYGPPMNSPDYLAINPMGKVPVIRHGDVVVTEAAAICAYLADAFPKARLAPAVGSSDRGPYYRWLFFGAGPVEAAVTNASFKFTAEGPEAEGRLGYGSLTRVCDALEGLFADGRRYILGDRFSAADVYLGSQIGWGMQFKTLPERPGFADYWARLAERKAYQRATEIDDALLPKREGAGG